jgi:hypothetical protein
MSASLTVVDRFSAGYSAFVQAFREGAYNPSQTTQIEAPEARAGRFNRLWQLYTNTAFEDVRAWNQYVRQYGLYKKTRPIYNPTRKLVNFYVGKVYPGVLSEDGAGLPADVKIAIPLARDIHPLLRSAIAQCWRWSNWQAGKALFVRYGAATGSVLVEVVDEPDRGKVRSEVVWPGHVKGLVLDSNGNVKRYALEYRALDPDGQEFKFQKIVDGNFIRFYRDDQPYDFMPRGFRLLNEDAGREAMQYERLAEGVYFHPYGFCPAVWVKHQDLGGEYGSPAIGGSIAKVDELNSLVSHIHDQIHKTIDPSIILWAKQKIERAFKKRDEEAQAGDDREYDPSTDILILKGPEGGSKDTLVGDLNLADALPYVESLIGEIEGDHPELTLYSQLRKMERVSGPGAATMVGDAVGVFDEVSANYDLQSIKLFQMQVAIAGYRYQNRDGLWALRTPQQQRFQYFDITSYQRGDLEFAIMPRPLIPTTVKDDVELMGRRVEIAQSSIELFDLDKRLQVAGIEDAGERARIVKALREEAPTDPLNTVR